MGLACSQERKKGKKTENRDPKNLVMVGLKVEEGLTKVYKQRFGGTPLDSDSVKDVKNTHYEGVYYKIWDFGDEITDEAELKEYILRNDGLIYVVDTSNKEKFESAKNHLHKLLSDEDLKGKAFLVIADRQEIKMSVIQITDALDLPSVKGREWYAESVGVLTAELLQDEGGIPQAFEWLNKILSKKKEKSNKSKPLEYKPAKSWAISAEREF